ncbi:MULTISPECIES: AAA family ATPase [unclassified Leeuwenhoekiella]|uniref:AAA family ATPase n=1 Tax=unclassified Leeuwenhoekiella TaxID=2615029 RepID=UPI000C54F0FB|nr:MULTISPECIES: AAA family ATPase [unclassified Leeuwenhoekiella]MAW96577.1 ATP-binding protein [Leeuwenhoekiella sp.]MBA81465.1 ATP-binding protein [Leeuwenhoekiella sp.]|tara:strand:- start:2780 stop:5398 length:2619 start_codon:yes stop_codon:yes gene_type:complete
MPILNDIIDWVENKPIFWQIAVDRLIRNNELTDNDISELKEICKVDYGLSDFDFNEVDFDNLREFANNSTSTEDIILSKISNVNNINALSHTSELEFASNGLTLVYGDNGSGKSSYVSILKHACNTRGSKPKINDNLYDPTCFGNDKKADIEYTIDGVNFNTVNLINEVVSDSVLKSIDVFDTFSANHYIEGEDEIAFIPQGLSIVEKLADCIKKVDNELNAEFSEPALEKFDHTLIEVSDCSTAKTFLNNLNSETTLNELRAEAIWNETKNSRIEELTKQIDKLKATDPKKILKENIDKIKRFEILQNKLQTLENNLTGTKLEDLKQIINNLATTSKALKESSEKAFSELPIEGVGNSSWKLLWESARKFYNESTETEDFPKINGESNCPLCFQDLGEDAKSRFNAFEDFVKNDIQKSFDEASDKFDLEYENLNSQDFSFEEQKPTTIELDELIDEYSENQTKYLESLSKQKDYLVGLFNSKKSVESINSIEIENTPKTQIQNLIKDLKEANKKLAVQSIEEDLRPLNKEVNQLKGEKKIFDYKPKLAREIYRQKKIKLLNQCISKCNTRTITTLSNDLATNYISQNLKQNFKAELTKLGFKNIKIETETKGQRGKQYHYLRLDEQNSNGIALKDVLSEGEHRCISLATFLSELSISEHKSAIIFDDPVSSLDHKWRSKISKRIAEEALERQVIVFTHDITFLLMIQEHSKSLNCDLDIKSLTRKRKETGLIASNPPWDALPVGKRIGLLKDAYQKLEKIERTETEEVYKERAKMLYGKLRETWERFIEEVFLNGAIQRFGRAIQTQRLSKIVDLTDDDYNIVDANMSKCSTYFTGHDTAGTLIEEMPDSAEFLADLTVLEDYIKTIRRRR